MDFLTSTLGVDAIWLSPFYPSPVAEFGYDVSNYTDVDAMFRELRHILDEYSRERTRFSVGEINVFD